MGLNRWRPASVIAGAGMALAPIVAIAGPLPDAEIAARVESVLTKMTPAEKAAQIVVNFALPGGKEATDRQVVAGAGAVLFVSDPKEANRLQKLALEKSRLGIPLLLGFDVVHGLSTIFPVPIGLAASWDPALVERSHAIAAREARASGIHWTFGPMVDIARDPRWGRMVEGSGEDPFLGSVMAAAQVRGFQGPFLGAPGRLIAGPKHFVGYGAAAGGRDYDEANISDEELWNVHLPPFKAAIDAGAGNVMTAYMPLNGVPATANRWLLTDVLRRQWGFQGWVVSDNSAVNALRTHGVAETPLAAAKLALDAGLDMEMSFAPSVFAQQLPEAVSKGLVTQSQIDAAVRRVLAVKFRLGLFDQAQVEPAIAANTSKRRTDLEAARNAAERSAVLLKNEGALLPLDEKRIRSIAIVGPLADAPRDTLGPWVFAQNAPVTETIVAGIRAKLGPRVNVTYEPGVSVGKRIVPNPMTMAEGKIERPEPADEDAGIARAVADARAADVTVVVVGEAFDMIGELASRSTLDLPGRQQELLDAVVATGKPVVVVVMNGRPLDLHETKAAAILDVWYPGSRGGAATANLLFGDAVPGGKLPFTWPRNVGQVPLYYARLPTHDPRNANSRYWNEAGAPTYPFGHGLSYTTFDYAKPQVSKTAIGMGETVEISTEVTNSGARAGDEVVQFYIHQKGGTASRPVRELKGFQRLALKAGETRKVAFAVGPQELRYWNAAARDWVVDETAFEVAIGGSSAAPLVAGFTVTKNP